jgi:hypothetical protein
MKSFAKLTWALGLLLLICTSCVDSEKPLSDPKQSTADPGLSGVWRGQNKDSDVESYHVGLVGDNFPAGMLRIKCIVHDKNGQLPHPDNDDLLAFTTTLGNNHYLNVTSLSTEQIKKLENSKWEPSMADGYFLARYELTGDKLVIAFMDDQQKKEAIKAGKIKGNIDNNPALITDTMENLVRFVTTADQEKLFPTKDAPETCATLERLK